MRILYAIRLSLVDPFEIEDGFLLTGGNEQKMSASSASHTNTTSSTDCSFVFIWLGRLLRRTNPSVFDINR